MDVREDLVPSAADNLAEEPAAAAAVVVVVAAAAGGLDGRPSSAVAAPETVHLEG